MGNWFTVRLSVIANEKDDTNTRHTIAVSGRRKDQDRLRGGGLLCHITDSSPLPPPPV